MGAVVPNHGHRKGHLCPRATAFSTVSSESSPCQQAAPAVGDSGSVPVPAQAWLAAVLAIL